MNSQLLLPLLIVLFAVMFYMQIRRQKKANQAQQKLQNSLTAGDRVMTTSGLFGTVVSTADTSVDLEISPGVVTTWLSAAIREKVDTEQDSDGDAVDTADDDTAEVSGEAKAVESDSAESKTEADTAEAKTPDSKDADSKTADSKAADTESGAEVAEPIEKQKTS